MKPAVTVFIPAYNEEENIEYVVREAVEVLKQVTEQPQIVVVDDGSRDNTGKILDNLTKHITSLKVIHHPVNMGVGKAMVNGFMAATGELIFFNSADRQAPMSYLLKMLPLMNDYDLVVACYPKRKDSIIRVFFSRCYHFLVRILFNVKVRNINAMKLLKKEVFDRNVSWGRNLCIDTEIVVRAEKRGFKIRELPLEHFPRIKGSTKVVSIRNTLKTFISLWCLYQKLRNEKK